MAEYRVKVNGVWPDLTPSRDPLHYFDRPFESEAEAREFFEEVEYPATLYWIDRSIGPISRHIMAERR